MLAPREGSNKGSPIATGWDSYARRVPCSVSASFGGCDVRSRPKSGRGPLFHTIRRELAFNGRIERAGCGPIGLSLFRVAVPDPSQAATIECKRLFGIVLQSRVVFDDSQLRITHLEVEVSFRNKHFYDRISCREAR